MVGDEAELFFAWISRCQAERVYISGEFWWHFNLTNNAGSYKCSLILKGTISIKPIALFSGPMDIPLLNCTINPNKIYHSINHSVLFFLYF